jgi:hypothetical protein
MLVLKELRLANDEKTVTNTALLAVAGSGCTSPAGAAPLLLVPPLAATTVTPVATAAVIAAGTKAAVAARARASGSGMAALPSHAVALLVLPSRLAPWVLGSATTLGRPKAFLRSSRAGVLISSAHLLRLTWPSRPCILLRPSRCSMSPSRLLCRTRLVSLPRLTR